MKSLLWPKIKRRPRLVFIYIVAIAIILLTGYLIAPYTDAFRSYSPTYYEPKDIERDEWLRRIYGPKDLHREEWLR